MIPLEIDLQDGFTGQALVVRLDAQDIASFDRVMTRPQTGLAQRVRASVAPGRHTVTVDLLNPSVRHSAEIAVEAPCYVGFNLKANTLTMTVQDRPFRYL